MRKLKDFISTFETEIVKLFKKYEVVQGCFKHKPVVPVSWIFENREQELVFFIFIEV